MYAQSFDHRGFDMPTFLKNCFRFEYNLYCIDIANRTARDHYWTWKPAPPLVEYVQQPGILPGEDLPDSGTFSAVMHAARKCDESASAWRSR